MKKHSLGKRLLAMVLVLASVLGYFPAILANAESVGTIIPTQTGTDIKGG